MGKKKAKTVKLNSDREFQPAHISRNDLGWFEMSAFGSFRIVVEDEAGKMHRGFPTFYEGIATLEVDGVKYIGVSAYFQGVVPHECVLRVSDKKLGEEAST